MIESNPGRLSRREVLGAGAVWLAGTALRGPVAAAGGLAPTFQEPAPRMRRVWLRLLLESIEQDLRAGKKLSDDAKYLAGLTRVRFLYVDEQRKDVVLEGPAEDKWDVRPDGIVIGAASRQPLLQLDDFAVAWRNANDGSPPPSMSLESRDESVQRVQQIIRNTAVPTTAAARTDFTRRLQDAWGPQDVVTAGVPAGTRFNKVMSDADWEMKRISLGLSEASIKEITAYVDLEFADLRRRVRAEGLNARKADGRSRFWFYPGDAEFLQTEKRDAVALPDNPVQLLTETHFRNRAQGLAIAQEPTAAAKEFVASFSKHFAALAAANPLYAELRNLFDWVAVARLFRLLEIPRRTGVDLRLLRDGVRIAELDVPATMPGQVAVRHAEIKVDQGVAALLFPARGGVSIDGDHWFRTAPFRIAASLESRRRTVQADGPPPRRFWR